MISVLLAGALAAPPVTAELVVRSDRAAPVLYAVFPSREAWLKSGQAIRKGSIAPRGGEGAALLSLPPGRYAVAVFQDLDGDGRMKRGVLGVPAEPVAFSNRARARMGPPRFADAVVLVEAGHARIEIDLPD